MGSEYGSAFAEVKNMTKMVNTHMIELFTQHPSEVDETYWGGRRKPEIKMSNKSSIMGMVERGGRIRVKKIAGRDTGVLLGNIKENISRDSHLMTDDFVVYRKAPKLGYKRSVINHSKKQYASGNIHTNTIEGWWSQFKRSVHGSYHSVSAKYLQNYLDEFAFRYNLRDDEIPVFQWLLYRLVR